MAGPFRPSKETPTPLAMTLATSTVTERAGFGHQRFGTRQAGPELLQLRIHGAQICRLHGALQPVQLLDGVEERALLLALPRVAGRSEQTVSCVLEQGGQVRLQECHYATPVGGENAAHVRCVDNVVRPALRGCRRRRTVRSGLHGIREYLIEGVYGRAVSALEGNAHAAGDDSRDQHGDFELLYGTVCFRGKLYGQNIVTLQCLVADDNAAAIGALDREKQTAWTKVLNLTGYARAARDTDPGVNLQRMPYVLTPLGARWTAFFTWGGCRARSVGARYLGALAGYGHSLDS